MDTFNDTSEVDDSSTITSGGTVEGIGEEPNGQQQLVDTSATEEETVVIKSEEVTVIEGGGKVLEEEVTGLKKNKVVMEEDTSVIKDEEMFTEDSALIKGAQVVVEGNQVVMEGETPVMKTEQVVVEGNQVVVEGNQVVMEGTQVVMEGTQVMMEGTQVMMEGTQVVMEGSEVVMEETPVAMEDGGMLVEGPGLSFDTSMLEESKGEECPSPSGGLVMVKHEDLQDNRYGHNQQILGLVRGRTVEEEVEVVGGESQGKILLENLVSEALQSPQRPGQDNIIVTTSTITSAGQATALVQGVPPQATPTRIVVQTNHSSVPKANQGHFLIQVGGASVPVAPVVASSSPSPAKNHIDIHTGYNRISSGTPVGIQREEPSSPGQQGNIFKTSPGLNQAKPETTGDPKKLYECPTCNSKFMRPLYLRKHMRCCKKEEVKVEKAPLYMCSFCKMTFKTRPQISQHFLKCIHSPYRKKLQAVKQNNEGEPSSALLKKGKTEDSDIDSLLEQAVQFRCQDCDRTFSKERQYTSHIKRCTKISVHDLTEPHLEVGGEEEEEEELESLEDPFADSDPIPLPLRRGRGPGRRGRHPRRGNASSALARGAPKSSSQLIDGGQQDLLNPMCEGKIKEAMLNLSIEARELYLNSQVPILDAVPSPLVFFREWVAANKPVVVRGVTQHWPALTKWSPGYLRNKIGDKEVSVAVTPNGYADAPYSNFFVMPEERTMKFSSFLDIMEHPESQPGIFYVQKQNSNFTEEFSEIICDAAPEIPWFSEALGKSPDAVNFWMGDERAVTSMHKDNYENIYCVISGYKDFILLPPTDAPWVPYKAYRPATYKETQPGIFAVEPTNGKEVPWVCIDPVAPDLKTYPQYSHASPVHCRVRAGEALYLPSLWYHHVRQSHGCIAVNFWHDMEYDVKYNYHRLLQSLTWVREPR